MKLKKNETVTGTFELNLMLSISAIYPKMKGLCYHVDVCYV